MIKLSARQLAEKYQHFFEERGHKRIPSAPLVPENDPSALFISAGMHPLVPYLLGEVHPSGKRLVNVQECLRTVDIDQVGDTFHHTWFEMLGNWSLGDYFKKEMIPWSFEFLTKVLAIKPADLHVSCFAGDKTLPRDKETALIWQDGLGIDQKRIHFLPKKDNWWGPIGKTGPCGPDTEMFIDTGQSSCGPDCHPGCSCGKYIEIWNDVFMEYFKDKKGHYDLLKQKNVDAGMGVERTLAVISGFNDNYLTSIWQPIIKKIEELSKLSYQKEKNKKPMRIIADHLRSAVFIIADGILPSNKEQGYVLRRLIRRAVRQGVGFNLKAGFAKEVGQAVIDNQDNYAGFYPELNRNKEKILSVLEGEEAKFEKTLSRGLNEMKAIAKRSTDIISGRDAFFLYESFGFPLEMIIEEAARLNLKVDRAGFQKEQKAHQEKSRAAVKGRFKGGLSGSSPKMIQYHTATHLLGSALRKILGDFISQRGSNITEERMRFDFNYPNKLTLAEIGQVEALVNQKIKQNLAVKVETISFLKAKKERAITIPGKNYPDRVKVYSIGDFSKEVCGGPHVARTSELGRFKIIKEEASGSGIRRIYGILE